MPCATEKRGDVDYTVIHSEFLHSLAEYWTLYVKRSLDCHTLCSCSGSHEPIKPVLFQMVIATKSPSNLPVCCPLQFTID